MSLQIQRYQNGTYAVFGIKLHGWTRKFSAWFNENGQLTDAEAIDPRSFVSYPVTKKQKDRIEVLYGDY